MTAIKEKLRKPPATRTSWYGTVARAPADFDDMIDVIVPSFDTILRWTNCRWQPSGGSSLPALGDEVLVTLDDFANPWVAAWWPQVRAPKATTGLIADGPPANPMDGDIWIATNVNGIGIRWQFQYDAGWAIDAYKWKFVGGPPIIAGGNPGNLISGLTQISTFGWYYWAGTLVPVPRTGIYDVRSWVKFQYNTVATGVQLTTGYISPDNVGDDLGPSAGYVDATNQYETIPHESYASSAAGSSFCAAFNGISSNAVAVGAQGIFVSPIRIS